MIAELEELLSKLERRSKQISSALRHPPSDPATRSLLKVLANRDIILGIEETKYKLSRLKYRRPPARRVRALPTPPRSSFRYESTARTRRYISPCQSRTQSRDSPEPERSSSPLPCMTEETISSTTELDEKSFGPGSLLDAFEGVVRRSRGPQAVHVPKLDVGAVESAFRGEARERNRYSRRKEGSARLHSQPTAPLSAFGRTTPRRARTLSPRRRSASLSSSRSRAAETPKPIVTEIDLTKAPELMEHTQRISKPMRSKVDFSKRRSASVTRLRATITSRDATRYSTMSRTQKRLSYPSRSASVTRSQATKPQATRSLSMTRTHRRSTSSPSSRVPTRPQARTGSIPRFMSRTGRRRDRRTKSAVSSPIEKRPIASFTARSMASAFERAMEATLSANVSTAGSEGVTTFTECEFRRSPGERNQSTTEKSGSVSAFHNNDDNWISNDDEGLDSDDSVSRRTLIRCFKQTSQPTKKLQHAKRDDDILDALQLQAVELSKRLKGRKQSTSHCNVGRHIIRDPSLQY